MAVEVCRPSRPRAPPTASAPADMHVEGSHVRPHWREIGLVLHPHRFDAHGAAAHGTRPGRNTSTPASTCSGTARPAWVRRRGPVCGPGAAVSASGALREKRRLPLGRAARRLQLLLRARRARVSSAPARARAPQSRAGAARARAAAARCRGLPAPGPCASAPAASPQPLGGDVRRGAAAPVFTSWGTLSSRPAGPPSPTPVVWAGAGLRDYANRTLHTAHARDVAAASKLLVHVFTRVYAYVSSSSRWADTMRRPLRPVGFPGLYPLDRTGNHVEVAAVLLFFCRAS